MAKFRYEKSELASSLDRLQSFAENLISTKTNRHIQLGREKEARMINAYQYMLGNEDKEISELEQGLDFIEQNLMDRGVELKGLRNEYKTVSSEELLAAANEGAAELLNVKLEDSKRNRDSLQKRKSKAMQIKRNIDLFDDALSIVDPSLFGDPNLVEAGDVAVAAEDFIGEYENMKPYLDQRLATMQSKGSLRRLQDAWIDKVNKDVEGRIAQVRAGNINEEARLGILEGGKQQTQEAVGAYLSDGIGSLNSAYVPLMGLHAEIASRKDAETGEVLKEGSDALNEKQTTYNTAMATIGDNLFPWSTSIPEARQNAEMFQASYLAASGLIVENGKFKRVPPNYNSLVSYLAVANAKYKMASSKEQAQWSSSIFKVLGIDITDTDAIQGIIDMNESARRIDIEEGEIYLDRYMGNVNSSGSGGNEETDDELQEMMQLFLSGQVGKVE